MKRHKRFAAGLLCGMLIVSTLFTGCSVGKRQIYFDSKSGRGDVFKIGELSCPKEEAKVYLANYKNLYGNLYGTDLWTEEYDTGAMEDSIKDAVLSHLTKVYALNLYAMQQGITLSDAEKEEVDKAAKAYYDSLNRKEKSYTGASKSDVQQMYARYALAEKMYVSLMESVDGNVSEDEARVIDAYVLMVKNEKLADKIDKKIKNGVSFDRLASSYNELDSMKATFGRGTYEKAIEDVVFSLDNDEVSSKITTEDGYYFFQCRNKYNEQLSEENKLVIVEQRQKQAMEDVKSAIEKEYYSHFNTKLWDKISAPTSSEVTTNSFFSTLDSYMSH